MAIARRVVVREADGIDVRINAQEIPDCVMNIYISSLIKSVEGYFAKPGVAEEYQEWLKKRKGA